jgi:hypothetical protein
MVVGFSAVDDFFVIHVTPPLQLPRDFIGVLLVLLFDQTEHGSPLRVVLLVAVPPQGHLAVPHLLRYVSRGWFRPVLSIHHTLVALDERLVLRDRGDGRLGSVANSFLLHGQEFLLGVLEAVSWRSLVVFGRGTALTRSDLRGRFGSRFIVPRVIRNVLFLPVVVLIFGDVLLAGFRNGGVLCRYEENPGRTKGRRSRSGSDFCTCKPTKR